MRQLYSDEELLMHVVELGNELGKVPSIKDMNKAEQRPSGALYLYRFGSWNAALDKVGMKPRKHWYTDGELIVALQKLAERLGRAPRRIEINRAEDSPILDTYERRFGSYEDALVKAGLEPASPYIQITDEELIKKLNDLTRVLGHVPSYSEIAKEKNYPHPSTYQDRFGSWTEAIKKAGLERSRKFYSDDELILELKKLAKELGHTPAYLEMTELKDYANPRTYVDRFGSWRKAVEKAGLIPVKRGYSNEELFKYMMELKKKLGRMPHYIEMLSVEGCPSSGTYQNHFGSWKKRSKPSENGWMPRRTKHT